MENLQAMKRISFIIATILVCFIGCAPKSVRHTLSDIETFIQERPDSALSILDTMDRASLTTSRSRAHHALLHAMALDKNFIDVSDDSIAQVAVDYFSKHGPQKYHARSLYYLGLAYYYQEDYNKAIVEFTKAEEVAEACDSLYLGMIKGGQAFVYKKTYNPIEEINCLNKAYEIYSSLSSKYYEDVTKLTLVHSLYNQNHIEQANLLLSDLLNDTNLNHKVKLASEITIAFTSILLNNEDEFSSAVQIYDSVFCSEDSTY